jgi:hypothetical protein
LARTSRRRIRGPLSLPFCQALGDGVEIVRRGFNAGIALDQHYEPTLVILLNTLVVGLVAGGILCATLICR